MTHTFEEGDFVRDTRANREGILVDINPNEDYVKDDESWAELEHKVTSEFVADVFSPNDLELITKKADLPERRLPTREELRKFLGTTVLDEWGEIQVDESDPDGENSLIIYGRMNNQRFSARIVIDHIEWGD